MQEARMLSINSLSLKSHWFWAVLSAVRNSITVTWPSLVCPENLEALGNIFWTSLNFWVEVMTGITLKLSGGSTAALIQWLFSSFFIKALSTSDTVLSYLLFTFALSRRIPLWKSEHSSSKLVSMALVLFFLAKIVTSCANLSSAFPIGCPAVNL